MNVKEYFENIKKAEMAKDQNNVAQWDSMYEELKGIAIAETSARQIFFDKRTGLCPYLRNVRFDALDSQDYPHGIAENSVFLTFQIDFATKKVELWRTGGIHLSPKDKQTPKYKYLCMKSMVNVLQDKGGKKFRKQTFKNMADLFNKMESYYKEVMQAVTEYTGGYPFKEGKEQATDETQAA